MPISTLVLGSFATGKVIEYIIGGCIGNRADHLLCKSSTYLKERLIRTSGTPENHDLEKAIHSSIIDATIILCYDYVKENYSFLKFFMNEEESELHDFIKDLKNRHNNLLNDKLIAENKPLIPYQLLIEKKETSESRLIEIELSLWSRFLKIVTPQKMKLHDDLISRIQNGWSHKGKSVRWLELICAFFNEKIKTNPRVSEIIQSKLLVNINSVVSGLQLDHGDVLTQLNGYYSLHKATIQRLDEITLQLDNIESTLENLRIQGADIFNEVKIQTLSQQEILYILNKIHTHQSKTNAAKLDQLKQQNGHIIKVLDNIAGDSLTRKEATYMDRAELLHKIEKTASDIFIIEDKLNANIVTRAKLLLEEKNGIELSLELLNLDNIQMHFKSNDYSLEDCAEAIELRVNLLESRYAYQEAINSYEWLINMFDKNGQKTKSALYRIKLSSIHTSDGHFNQAHKRLKEALSLIDSTTENNELLAEVYIDLGELFCLKGDLSQAWPWITKAEDTIDHLNKANIALQNSLYLLMSRYYSASKKYKQTLFYLQMAIDTHDQVNEDESSLSAIYNNVALTYYDLDDYDKANHWFQSSLDLINIDPIASDLKRSSVIYNMALIKHDKGDIDGAIEDFKSAINSVERKMRPNHPILCLAYHSLAGANFQSNNILEAYHYIKKSKKIMEEHFSSDYHYRKQINQSYKMIRYSVRSYNFTNSVILKWKRVSRFLREITG